MERHIFLTADGSTSIHVQDLDEQYHSRHGAIAESRHVFLTNGMDSIKSKSEIKILEMGFGTGLNALLTCNSALDKNLFVDYTTVEKYPLTQKEIEGLNFTALLDDPQSVQYFRALHRCPWEQQSTINPCFTLTKLNQDFRACTFNDQFNLVYYDAFAPDVQPALWSQEMMESMFKVLVPGGIFVTYSAKGSVRRLLEKVGFSVERLQGPPGKRHMVRAAKPIPPG